MAWGQGSKGAWERRFDRRIRAMRALFHLLAFLALLAFGGILLIKLSYGCSWRESVDIADQFLADLLG